MQPYSSLSVKELYEKYQELNDLAKTNLNTIPLSFRSGREGMIRSAAAEIPEVARLYRNKVTDSAVIIAVSGEYSKEFADLARDKLDMLSLNYLKAADQTAERVIARGYPDQYTSNTHHMALDEVVKLKNECGIFSLPIVQQMETTGFLTLKDGLRGSLEKSFQGQFYTLVTKNDIGLIALKNGFTGGKIPVVLYNYNKEMPIDQTFLPVPLVQIDVNSEKECNLENVKTEIKKVQELFKKKSTKKSTKTTTTTASK